MKNEPVVIERVLNASKAKIWQALTDKDLMKQWYFDLKEFKPEVGFEFRFYGGTEEKQYLHICEITEVIKEQKIAYTWRFEGYVGESLVTFEMFSEGNQTKVRLTHAGLETFPADDPNMSVDSYRAGWNEIMNVNLAQFVEKEG